MVDSDVVDKQAESDDAEESATEAWERDRELSIHQRIHAIMGEVGHVEKDGQVKIGGGSYAYISHDAVTASIRGAFVKHGVIVQPTIVNHGVNGNRTELDVRVDFINVDKPNDRLSVDVLGYGVDTSDKGPGKAMSYAVKYAYMKVLMLNSADDIEAANVEHDPDQPRVSQQAAIRDKEVATQQAWATNYKAALQGAKSIAEIKTLRRANREAMEDVPEVTRKFLEGYAQDRLDEFEAAEQDED